MDFPLRTPISYKEKGTKSLLTILDIDTSFCRHVWEAHTYRQVVAFCRIIELPIFLNFIEYALNPTKPDI